MMGGVIDSEWVLVDMGVLVVLVGEDFVVVDVFGNFVNLDKIVNFDNLKFFEKLCMLFIGEDLGMYVNNFLWVYNVDMKLFVCVLLCLVGVELMGLYVVDEINGWIYIMSNF